MPFIDFVLKFARVFLNFGDYSLKHGKRTY